MVSILHMFLRGCKLFPPQIPLITAEQVRQAMLSDKKKGFDEMILTKRRIADTSLCMRQGFRLDIGFLQNLFGLRRRPFVSTQR